jgi:hypothetical protein
LLKNYGKYYRFSVLEKRDAKVKETFATLQPYFRFSSVRLN